MKCPKCSKWMSFTGHNKKHGIFYWFYNCKCGNQEIVKQKKKEAIMLKLKLKNRVSGWGNIVPTKKAGWSLEPVVLANHLNTSTWTEIRWINRKHGVGIWHKGSPNCEPVVCFLS